MTINPEKPLVLVTGSTGMVGKNLISHPLAKNFRLLTPTRYDLDLCNATSCLNYLERHQPTAVIHLAGKVGGIQANINFPMDYFIINLESGLNLLQSCLSCGVDKVLNFGSSCMYPAQANNPLNEEQLLTGALEPTNEGYALAKLAIAKFCEYIFEQQSYDFKTLIPCNLYGFWDKFDPVHSHLIAAVIRKLHEAKIREDDSVEIWGTGNVRREFMFAEDLAEFTWRAVENFDALPRYLNVGPGTDHTILEYYQIAKEIIGYRGEFRFDLQRPEGMQQKLLDVQKLSELGWAPGTDLRSGIERTYQHFISIGNH